MADKRTFHRGDDGLLYDQDGYFVYEGVSPLSEDEDVEQETDAE